MLISGIDLEKRGKNGIGEMIVQSIAVVLGRPMPTLESTFA